MDIQNRGPITVPTKPSRPRTCLGRGALLALVVVQSVALATPAWAKPDKKPPSAQGSACGGPSNPQAFSGVELEDIAAFFGARVKEWSTFMVLDIGFDKISKLIGLDRILGDDGNEKILDELKVIDAKLDGISARLAAVQTLTAQIERDISQLGVDFALEDLCKRKVQEETAFNQFYSPWISAGVELGEALKAYGAMPTFDNAVVVFFAKLKVLGLQESFKTFVVTNGLVTDSQTISAALVPGTNVRTSLLTAYGKVLLQQPKDRYLTIEDSAALFRVYDEFAQVEALASWMSAEYFKTVPNTQAVDTVAGNYAKQLAFEEASLPKVIPEGIVIDLGSADNPSTTNKKPLWFVPSTDALCWFPAQSILSLYPSSDRPTPFPVCDEVGVVMAELNTPRPGKVTGDGWVVPTMAQLASLLANDCLADPANPAKFIKDHDKCSSPLGGMGTARVGDYLAKLNPTNDVWQLAFCGPTTVNCTLKPHVWTTDLKNQEMRCGREGFYPWGYIARNWLFRTGYYLTATNLNDLASVGLPSAWQTHGTNIPGIPLVPDRNPHYDGDITDLLGHQLCDQYIVELFRGGPRFFPQPSPSRKGALIATRYSNAFDLKMAPVGMLDYMAQIVGN